MITECSFCKEPLQEEEIEFYDTHAEAMPLCTSCLHATIEYCLELSSK